MSKIDLIDNSWVDLVFEGKNQAYGAYQLRKNTGVILADSGMMQSTAEKKHLLLNLYDGVWNENMRSQDLAETANVPYRRETFSSKRIVLDFDGDFNLADVNEIAGDARAKGLGKILSINDSVNSNRGWERLMK